MKQFKKLRGAFSQEEGKYMESRIRNGVYETPYKYGTKVYWLGEERAARFRDEVESVQKEVKSLHTKKGKSKLKEESLKTGKKR